MEMEKKRRWRRRRRIEMVMYCIFVCDGGIFVCDIDWEGCLFGYWSVVLDNESGFGG